TSTNGGTGNTSTALLTVNPAPPTIAKAFGAPSILLGGTTTLTVTVHNPNVNTTLTGVGYDDIMPAGLVTVPATIASAGTCNGPGSANASHVGLSNNTLPPGTSCTFSIDVQGQSPGTQNNVTTTVSSNEAGAGAAASANIDVVGPPALA